MARLCANSERKLLTRHTARLAVGAHQRMREIEPQKKLVYLDAPQDQVDDEVALPQDAAFVLKLVGGDDLSFQPVAAKYLAKQKVVARFGRLESLAELHHSDTRLTLAAELLVRRQKRGNQRLGAAELRQIVLLAELLHGGAVIEQVRQGRAVSHADRSVGAVADKMERLRPLTCVSRREVTARIGVTGVDAPPASSRRAADAAAPTPRGWRGPSA